MKERTYHKHRRSVRVDRGSVPARLGWGYAVGRRVRAAWGGLVVRAVAAPRATGAVLVLAARAAGAGAVDVVARTVGAVLSGLAVPARAVRPAVEILAASARAAAPRARTAADAIVVSRRAFRAVRPGARRTSQRQVRGCGSPAGPYTSDTGSDTGTVGLTGRSD